jgi:hypothetical protein
MATVRWSLSGRRVVLVAVALVLLGLSATFCFVAYLVFCAFVIVRTGSTAGLRDVAVAMRAFGAIRQFRGKG